MKYKVTEIQKDVRVIMDNNSKDTSLLSVADVDTLQFDELIKSKICDAARYVIDHAETYLLGAGKKYTANIQWASETMGVGSGIIPLPDDLQRIIVFQMSDWNYALTKFITEDSPIYSRQFSRYAGVRGCPQRPVAAIINHLTGLALAFFSCKEGGLASIKTLRYVPVPTIKEAEDDFPNVPVEPFMEIPEKLYDAVKYYTAFLVASTLEMPTSSLYSEIAKTYLQ